MNFMINFQFVTTFKVLFSSDTHVSITTSHFSNILINSILVIMSSLWENQHYRDQIVNIGNNDPEFIRFVNMLINDTTFLLDEAVASLKRIHEIQEMKKREAEWNAKSQESRDEIDKEYVTQERQVSSYLTLATQTLSTFNYLTKNIKKPFLKPEVADRLTAMLNINLKQLCGSHQREVKVENREKYGWRPSEMLKSLADLYLNLQCDEFIEFLAKEERSYSPALFNSAVETMIRVKVIDDEGAQQWRSMSARVEAKWNELQQEDEDFDDVPDEFLDPVMGTLMTDPVLLPASGKLEALT